MRSRLVLSVVWSVILSTLDMLGVIAILPLLQVLSGTGDQSSVVERFSTVLGDPSEGVLIAYLAGLVVLIFLVKDVLAIFVRRWQFNFIAREEPRVSAGMLEIYLNFPYSIFRQRKSGDMVWAIEGAVGAGFSGALSGLLNALTEVFTIALIFVSLLVISPGVAAAGAVYFGLSAGLIMRIIRRKVAEASRQNRIAGQVSMAAALQPLGAAKEIKLRNAQAGFIDDYRHAKDLGASARSTAMLLAELPKYLLEIVFVVGIGLLALWLQYSGAGSSAFVTLGVFLAAGTRILPSAVRLMSALNTVRFARESLTVLVEETALGDLEVRQQAERLRTQEVPHGDIVCDDVVFVYDRVVDDHERVRVLNGVDLRIGMGQTVGIVGTSGAGKTTLIDLLLGLQEPTQGSITAGGVNINDNLPAWQRQLAVVPQEVFMLDGTLTRNIAFDEGVDEARLHDVVERAQLRDLVDALPDGLDTDVGDKGVRLSGGQRQRIGIARALYRRPSYMFMDEATSALDNQTEKRLTETVHALRGSMTIIIVAHRLSTVRDCDLVLFMRDGRVETSGSFEFVRAHNEEFARLVALGSLDGAAGMTVSPD